MRLPSLPCLGPGPGGQVSVAVRVQPKASHNRVAGLYGDALKLCITAPPVEGRANTATMELLAALFRIPKSAVTLQTGARSRTKRFLLAGISMEEARRLLAQALPCS